MIIIVDNNSKQYAKKHGTGNTILNWDEMDEEAKKSVVMLTGRKPDKFPAVVDEAKRVMVDGAVDAPKASVDARVLDVEQKKEKAQRVTLEALSARIDALEAIIERLK